MSRLYPSIPHLPGSRAREDRTLAASQAARCIDPDSRPIDGGDDGEVIVQEKLDGSCVAIVRAPDGSLEARGREGRLASESPNEARRMFARWVVRHRERLEPLVRDGEILVGEWLALVHGTRYELPHEPFVPFDLFRPPPPRASAQPAPNASGMRLRATVDELAARITTSGLVVPAVVARGMPIAPREAMAILGASGRHHALDGPEGLVYRVERSCRGRRIVALVAKWVSPSKVDGRFLPENTGREALYHWREPPSSREPRSS